MQIEIADLQDSFDVDEDKVKEILENTLKAAGKDAELSVVLVNDDKIRELNNSYLSEDTPTDVLSFELDDVDEEADGKINGEIIVSIQTAVNTAKKMGGDVECEIFLYLVHGLLHLMGYDDKDEKMADAMHKEEAGILSGFGFKVDLGGLLHTD